ncbi:MAG: hypothetical protein AB9903_28880 [Vulcanimicrobiota bacterium]
MRETSNRRCRLSIDIESEEHRMIKMCAAMNDESVRSYVLKALRERLDIDMEREIRRFLTTEQDPVLAELWNNEKDSIYDKL